MVAAQSGGGDVGNGSCDDVARCDVMSQVPMGHTYGFSVGVGVGTGRVTHGLPVLCTADRH